MVPSCRFGNTFPLLLIALLLVWAPVHGADSGSIRVVDDLERTVRLHGSPDRVFSGALYLDSILLQLLPARRLAAVTRYARDPQFSFVTEKARSIPTYEQVRPETVLRHAPDLVFLSVFTRPALRRQVFDLGRPVVVAGRVLSVQDIERVTRLVARAVGRPERGERILGRMNRRLEELKRSARGDSVRVLYYTPSGVTAGRGTLPHLIMKHSGITNVAARAGIRGWKTISTETLLENPPDWIAVESINRSVVRRNLRNDPALRHLQAVQSNRIVGLDPKYMTVASPFLPRAVQRWQKAFRKDPVR